MTSRNVSVHIGKLVVDGVEGLDSVGLQNSVQRELRRLLVAGGLSTTLASRSHIDGGAIDTHGAGSAQIGRRIARAAYGAMGGSR